MLVVLVHITAGLYYENGVFSDIYIGYLNQMIRMGTPIFTIISSFLLMSAAIKKNFGNQDLQK